MRTRFDFALLPCFHYTLIQRSYKLLFNYESSSLAAKSVVKPTFLDNIMKRIQQGTGMFHKIHTLNNEQSADIQNTARRAFKLMNWLKKLLMGLIGGIRSCQPNVHRERQTCQHATRHHGQRSTQLV